MRPTHSPIDSTDARETPAVELYVRSLAPGEATAKQEAVIERLDRLASDDRVASYDVRVWGDRFDPSSMAAQTAAGQFARDRIASFRTWARRNSASLTPSLDTRTIESAFTDEARRTVSFPVMVLAEFTDGALGHVAPCQRDSTHWPVLDRLDTLERSTTATTGTEVVPVPHPPTEPPRTPED